MIHVAFLFYCETYIQENKMEVYGMKKILRGRLGDSVS